MRDWKNRLKQRREREIQEQLDEGREKTKQLKSELAIRRDLQAEILAVVQNLKIEKSLHEILQHAVIGNPKYGYPKLARTLNHAQNEVLYPLPAYPRILVQDLEEWNLRGEYLHTIAWEMQLGWSNSKRTGLRVEVDQGGVSINEQHVILTRPEEMKALLLKALDQPIVL